MGCWNGTCGLTQLHIKHGQDVVVFPLVKNNGSDSLCYTTPFYAPVQIPFYAKYNDYGGGEECHGIGLKMVLNAIKESLVELPVGKNKYHDIAVTKEGFDDEKFFEAVHESRLFINGRYERQRRHVGFTMIHKDVWDHILENRVVEKYVGNGKGTGGYGNNYVYHKFSDILEDLPACVNLLFADDEGNPLRKFDPLRQLRRVMYDEESTTVNKAAALLSYEDYRFSNLIMPSAMILDLIHSKDKDGATEFLTEYLKFLWIDGFMLDTRKFWSPQAGAGSQAQEPEGYELLIGAMQKVLAVENYEDEEN